MSKNLSTFIISVLVFIALLALVIFSAISGMNLGFFNIWSVSSITSRYDEVKQKEESLEQRESSYKNSLRNLENVKTNFNEQKVKYEAISNDTINMIKEATTKENYNIEYMWIKLGNYARANKLSIILIEPGGRADIQNNNQNDNQNNNNTQNNTVSSTTSSSSNNNQQDSSSTTVRTTDALQIQVTGSYMSVADFVFDVENDKELRFRLDNISMDYVAGTTIKTTFDVKNLVINK